MEVLYAKIGIIRCNRLSARALQRNGFVLLFFDISRMFGLSGQAQLSFMKDCPYSGLIVETALI